MYAAAGQLTGSLIGTYLLSRFFLWLLKRWDGGTSRLIVVHAMSLTVCGLSAGLTFAGSEVIYGIGLYTITQAIWMIADLLRERKRDQSNVPAIRGVQRL